MSVARIEHWIGGAGLDGASPNGSGPVFNPATGEQTGAVALGGAAEVDRAVQAAREALPAWRDTPLSKRADTFFRIRHLISERKDELAAIVTREHGKVLSDAAGELSRGLEVIDYCCGLPTRGKVVTSRWPDPATSAVDLGFPQNR